MSEFCFRSISWELIDGFFFTNFNICKLIFTKSRLGLLCINFFSIRYRVMALDLHQNLVSAQSLENYLMGFDKILDMH